MKKNDWKERLNIVYSTNPDFNYQTEEVEQAQTLAPEKQNLRVWRDTHGRAGKVATVVRGFVGSDADLEELGKTLHDMSLAEMDKYWDECKKQENK